MNPRQRGISKLDLTIGLTIVGLGVALLSTVFGLAIGVVSGFYRRADAVIMRIMDSVMSIPSILLAIAHRRLDWKMLKESADGTMRITTMVIFILIGATVFSLVFQGVNGGTNHGTFEPGFNEAPEIVQRGPGAASRPDDHIRAANP